MKSIDPKLKIIIDEFISYDLINTPKIEAIILCGSQATGMATKHSDIDLCYIGQFSEFTREYKSFKGYEFQIMLAPWEWYEEVINSFERKSNIGTITTMLATGMSLWSSDVDSWTKLQENAKELFSLGPVPVSLDDLIKFQRRITDIFNNFIDSKNELTSTWIKINILQNCIDVHFVINNWWAVKPKYQIDTLRNSDPLILEYIEACLTGNNDAVLSLCNYVLRPLGGLLDIKSRDI